MTTSEQLQRNRGVPGLAESTWLAAGAALFLYLAFFRAKTPIYLFTIADGGVWIDEADRVVQGELIYRDFFEFLPPGIVYLNAAVLFLFGPRISAFGFAAVALGTIISCVLHSLSARAVASRWRLLPPVAFVVLVYAPHSLGNHKMPALLFGLSGLLVMLNKAVTHRRSSLAGFLFGLSTLFTLDFGFGMAAGTAFYLLLGSARAQRRLALAFAGGYLASIALVIGYFGWKAGPGAVFYDCIVFPFTRYKMNPANFLLIDLFHWGPRTLAQLTLSVGGVVAAIALLSNKAHDDPARVIAFAGLGLLAATAHRPLDALGLALRSAPLTVVLARALERRSDASRNRLISLDSAVVFVLAVGTLWGSVKMIAGRQWLDPLTKAQYRAGEVWMPWSIPEISWLESATVEGEPVFLLPVKGGLHFLTRTRNPTSFPVFVAGQNTAAQMERLLAEIEQTRPAVGIWRNQAPLPEMYRALAEHYDVAGTVNGHTLFRRKRQAADGPRDLTPTERAAR